MSLLFGHRGTEVTKSLGTVSKSHARANTRGRVQAPSQPTAAQGVPEPAGQSRGSWDPARQLIAVLAEARCAEAPGGLCVAQPGCCPLNAIWGGSHSSLRGAYTHDSW